MNITEPSDFQRCPLCHSAEVKVCFKKKDTKIQWREYLKCQSCLLVFLAPLHQLPPDFEKKRYDLHQNNPQDIRYIAFLKKLTDPLSQKLGEGWRGIDFGCGPGPAISEIFSKSGHNVCNYDPYYYREESLLKRKYDFITCSEVVEHFYHPRREFALLDC